jgi:hypothetical protein
VRGSWQSQKSLPTPIKKRWLMDILEQIDHALRDHSVGPDAMRWSPERVNEAPDPETVAPETVEATLRVSLSRFVERCRSLCSLCSLSLRPWPV